MCDKMGKYVDGFLATNWMFDVVELFKVVKLKILEEKFTQNSKID